jgi:hypothetical protein
VQEQMLIKVVLSAHGFRVACMLLCRLQRLRCSCLIELWKLICHVQPANNWTVNQLLQGLSCRAGMSVSTT